MRIGISWVPSTKVCIRKRHKFTFFPRIFYICFNVLVDKHWEITTFPVHVHIFIVKLVCYGIVLWWTHIYSVTILSNIVRNTMMEYPSERSYKLFFILWTFTKISIYNRIQIVGYCMCKFHIIWSMLHDIWYIARFHSCWTWQKLDSWLLNCLKLAIFIIWALIFFVSVIKYLQNCCREGFCIFHLKIFEIDFFGTHFLMFFVTMNHFNKTNSCFFYFLNLQGIKPILWNYRAGEKLNMCCLSFF